MQCLQDIGIKEYVRPVHQNNHSHLGRCYDKEDKMTLKLKLTWLVWQSNDYLVLIEFAYNSKLSCDVRNKMISGIWRMDAGEGEKERGRGKGLCSSVDVISRFL